MSAWRNAAWAGMAACLLLAAGAGGVALHGARVERAAERGRADLGRMLALAHEYRELNALYGKLPCAPAGRSGLTPLAIEKVAKSLGIEGNISSTTPQENPVEPGVVEIVLTLRVEQLPADKLARFLYGIEALGRFVRVKEMRLDRPGDTVQVWSANLTVAAFEEAAPKGAKEAAHAG